MKKLLIVDDQNIYCTQLEVALKSHFEVRTAKSKAEALEIMKGDIDIALIDIRLDEDDDANIDGLVLLEWIKMSKPHIATFVMSAYREFSYAEQALNLGARHFFKKPIDIFSLIAIIQEKS